MTPVIILVFLVACLGVVAIAASLMGGGVRGFKKEVYDHDVDEEMDGFSALFVSGAMTIAGGVTLIGMGFVLVFSLWRIVSTMW